MSLEEKTEERMCLYCSIFCLWSVIAEAPAKAPSMSLSVNFLFWLRPKPQFLLYLALLLGFNSDSKNNYFLISIVITINFYSIKIIF